MQASAKKIGLSASVAILGLGLTGTAPAQLAAAPDAATANGQLEEIVVTATKREEKLKDVPSAISVLTPRGCRSSISSMSKTPSAVCRALPSPPPAARGRTYLDPRRQLECRLADGRHLSRRCAAADHQQL